MTTPLILDIITVVILIAFVIGGIHTGFVRTLCSFLALFVAFFGAAFLAKHLTPYLAEITTPYALPSIVKKLESGETSPSQELDEEETQQILLELGLPESWSVLIKENHAQRESAPPAFTSPSQLLAEYILNIVIYAAVFLLFFIILLILWGMISRALHLVARLPVLSFFNRTLGALLGFVQGILALLILRWALCDLAGLIPPQLVNNTHVFQLLGILRAHLPVMRILF